MGTNPSCKPPRCLEKKRKLKCLRALEKEKKVEIPKSI
jgi:hypothetical protein